ncbi:MAG: leucine-rich repeat domain-containing protein, partial [Firmicutes bacterium]|nr:leucine-rich repeat domain-containing protein [Bacillota bacterium]
MEHTTVTWEDNFIFRGNTIIRAETNRETLTIPPGLSGRTITTIGEEAFHRRNTPNLVNVILPDTITTFVGSPFMFAHSDLRVLTRKRSLPNAWDDFFLRAALLTRPLYLYSPSAPIDPLGRFWRSIGGGQPTAWESSYITFDFNGGWGNANQLRVNHGTMINQAIAANPRKDGHIFAYWTLPCGERFDAGVLMQGELVLRANWFDSEFLSGDGSSRRPYLISTANHMSLLTYLVNTVPGWSYGRHFALNNDISLNIVGWELWFILSGINRWTPIGTEDSPFQGVFNGRGFVISGMFIEGDFYAAGLFGVVDGGQVRNIGVVESVAVGDSMYTGGIAGVLRNGGAVVNSYFRG